MVAHARPKVAFVHAHPDDELLATGALLTASVMRGCEALVLTCTLGEEGEVIPADLAHLEGAGEAFAQHRLGELTRALDVLDLKPQIVAHPEGGRFRDSGMAGSAAAAHPRALAGSDPAMVAGAVRSALEDFSPDAIVTYDPRGGYEHPDHIAVHRAVVAAVRSLRQGTVPLFAATIPASQARQDRLDVLALHLPAQWTTVPVDEPYPAAVVPDELVAGTVELCPSERAIRAAALEQHRTQVTVHDGWFALSNSIAQRLSPRDSVTCIDPATGDLIASSSGLGVWWETISQGAH